MNLSELHVLEKEVSAIGLFKGKIGMATAINLKPKAVLKEHITKTPAMLLCITGSIMYKDENEHNIELHPGDYINIVPNVKHWLVANDNSHLVLFT